MIFADWNTLCCVAVVSENLSNLFIGFAAYGVVLDVR